MEALQVIVLVCQVYGSHWSSTKAVDAYQKKCQKALIQCYEEHYPKKPYPENDGVWHGALKDCVKNR